jgi:dihydroorotate dehydrogenase electron transfer subunit
MSTESPQVETDSKKIYDLPLRVVKNERITPSINVLTFHAPEIASQIKAGQFLEIKTGEGLTPLLRRPFSIHRVIGNEIEIMCKVVGVGTEQIYRASVGESFLTMAPLGNTFGYDKNDFDVALLLSGGIGVAPMSLLESELKSRKKEVHNLIGARNNSEIVTRFLTNVSIATDDGSLGFKGNVVTLLKSKLLESNGDLRTKRLRAFACGPNPMLSALAEFCNQENIPCEVSIESMMGCGIGICYGCPVRIKSKDGSVHNKLLCQYGSVIDSKEIVFSE